MIINTFNPAWFIMFGVQVVLIVLIALLFGKKSPQQKERFFTGFYLFSVIFLIGYKVYLVHFSTTYETFWANELPLNLCQVASLLAYPAVKRNLPGLKAFCFFIGSLCSLMGLLMPVTGFYNIPLLSGDSIGFYGFHGLVFVQSISLVTLRLCRPQFRDIPKVLVYIAGIALLVHGCNLLLRATGLNEISNYFFTCDPENNPILGFLYRMIPVGYVYLLPILLPLYPVLCFIAFLVRKAQGPEAA